MNKKSNLNIVKKRTGYNTFKVTHKTIEYKDITLDNHMYLNQELIFELYFPFIGE